MSEVLTNDRHFEQEGFRALFLAHVDAWIEAAGIGEERKLPLFRTFGRNGEVTARPLYEATFFQW